MYMLRNGIIMQDISSSVLSGSYLGHTGLVCVIKFLKHRLKILAEAVALELVVMD
jgi:hypothetical protein